jgi:ADP-ribose pyrophosphatase YjhB (NUDIX family)
VVGVGAVILRDDRVVLIKRGKEPLRGRWVVPGGTVELGESLEDAVVRETLEETGLVVRPREVLVVFDRIERRDGAVAYHYVIVDYLCDWVAGEPRAASDALDVAVASREELAGYDLPEKALEVVLHAFERSGT